MCVRACVCVGLTLGEEALGVCVCEPGGGSLWKRQVGVPESWVHCWCQLHPRGISSLETLDGVASSRLLY